MISSPSDFIVHEIDLNMNEADQFDSIIPPLPQSCVEAVEDSSINANSLLLDILNSVETDSYCEYSPTLQQSIESFATACKERGFAESKEFSLPEGKKLSPEVLRDLSVCLCLPLNISFAFHLFLFRAEPERFFFVAILTWMSFCLLWTKSRPFASCLSCYNLG